MKKIIIVKLAEDAPQKMRDQFYKERYNPHDVDDPEDLIPPLKLEEMLDFDDIETTGSPPNSPESLYIVIISRIPLTNCVKPDMLVYK